MKLVTSGLALLILAVCGCGESGNSADNNDFSDDDNGDDVVVTPDAVPLPPDAVVIPDATPLPPDAIITVACTLEEIQPLGECAIDNCSTDLTATCFATNCFAELFGLSPSCRDCLITGVASGDLATTVAACVSGVPEL